MDSGSRHVPLFSSAKRFFVIVLSSMFVQLLGWAAYEYLKLPTGLFAVSAIATALLYHVVQLENETGLGRKRVFFASILIPFLIGMILTICLLLRYPMLSFLGANVDGVSKVTEFVSLYAARLCVNGVLLLLFSAVDAIYLCSKNNKKMNCEIEKRNE